MLNYAEKQGKKDATCKDENTFFANNKKISPKLELPFVNNYLMLINVQKYLDCFKKMYPSSVCVTEIKSGNEKFFCVKNHSFK